MKIVKFGVLALALFVVAAYAAGCSKDISSGKVLVEVNGEKITEGDLNFLSEMNPRIAQQISSPDGKKRIIDNLIEQDLLYQKAVKEGINRDPKVKAKADLYRRVIIAQALVDDQIEKAAKKYYDDNQNEFKKLKLSQIVVNFGEDKAKKEKGRTEADAQKIAADVKAKLDAGGNFDELAKEFSDDQMTKARGGNLGLVSKDDKRLAARGYQPVLDKAFEMKVGEVAGPIKAQNSFVIFTVTQGIEVEPFDQAKQQILFRVRGDARDKLLAELRKDSKIEYEDKSLEAAVPGEEPGAPGQPPVIKMRPEAAGQPPAVKIQPAGEAKPEAATAAAKAEPAKPAPAKAEPVKAEPAKPAPKKN